MKELFNELLSLIARSVVTANRSDRMKIATRAAKVIKEIRSKTDNLIDFSDDITKRTMNIVKKNKEIERELEYLKIAAGETLLEELEYTVDCMKKAVEYERKGRERK